MWVFELQTERYRRNSDDLLSAQLPGPQRAPILGVMGCRLRCGRRGLPLLEALAAKDRTPLRRLEGHSGFFPAPRTRSAGFHLLVVAAIGGTVVRAYLLRALGFTVLAALGLVLEILVVEKKLFPGRKYELRSAINALEDPILEFHLRD